MSVWPRTRALLLASIGTFLLLTSAVTGEPVHIEQAQEVAETFLRKRTIRPLMGSSVLMNAGKNQSAEKRITVSGFRELRGDDGSVIAYIAELKPRGFVATSADTRITPVVAYSFRTSFPGDQAGDNPLYRLLKADVRLRAEALAERAQSGGSEPVNRWELYSGTETGDSGAAVFQQWPEEDTTSTGGWLTTAWDQESPYNDFCPLDPADSERSYVGCVATALAQVLNHYKMCDARFDSSDSYTTFSDMSFDADSELYDFPTFEELNGYLAEIQRKYENQIDLNDTDVAALSFASGVAAQMDYSSKSSAASPFDLLEALRDKFGFYSAEMCGGLSGEFHQVLQENMINGLPALVGIAPDDSWGGHVVVCDGYNTDGEYHLNFGWNSEHPEEITEVWYHLPTDLMARLSLVTEVILNVQPVRPDIEVGPESLTFYAVPGQESEVLAFNVENSEAGVWIDSISSPSGFTVARWGEPFSDHIDPFQLGAAGSRTPVYVQFCPDEAKGYYGTVVIDYSSGSRKNLIVEGYSYTGGTQVAAGHVSGTWSQAGSPYFVSGDIEVPEYGGLSIEPGVRVVFAGPYGMTIGPDAKLTAEGSADSPIEFTALNKDIGWRGLRFLGSGSDDKLSHCSISFSKKNVGLIAGGEAGAGQDPMLDEHDNCGGAVYCFYSNVYIANCKITNNVGDNAGAIYCAESDPVISNTLIANNESVGGGIQCGGVSTDNWSWPAIRNCTIANNTPGGIFGRSWFGVELTNTIVWGNERYQILTEECDVTAAFCDIEGGYEGDGNIDADPCFFEPTFGVGPEFNASAANWALRSCSPCINSGTLPLVPPTDLAGAPRIHSEIVDIGAYENQSNLPLITIAPLPAVDAGFVLFGNSVAVGLEISNTGSEEFTLESLSIDDSNGVFSITGGAEGLSLAPGDSAPVEIGFAPAAEQKYTGTLHIHSTCSNAPDKAISLSAVGIDGTVVSDQNRGVGATSGTWTKAGGPYIVTSDIEIPKGRTLTIEPGVTVKFAGHFKFTVGYAATLRAIGTEAENILFTAIDPNEGWFGIRFVNSGSDDVLEHCTIEYSKKPRTGGGGYENIMGGAILCAGSWEAEPGYLVPSSPTVRNCLISHNRALLGGAIMCTDDSVALITENRILDNRADLGAAGMYIAYASPTITNNVIAHNSAGVLGGGVYNWIATPLIENNTIVHNRPSGLHFDVTTMYSWWPEPPVKVENNIIWRNEIYVAEDVPAGTYDVRYNDVQGGWEGEGNIDIDPLFADAENRDYHLMSQAGCWDPETKSWIITDATSPCIDAGSPNAAVADEPAPHGNRVNMGAYGTTAQASKSF